MGSIDLDSPVDEYHTVDVQFRRGVFHRCSMCRSCCWYTSLFVVAADACLIHISFIHLFQEHQHEATYRD